MISKLIFGAILFISVACNGTSYAANGTLAITTNIIEGTFVPGASVTVATHLTINDGFHINAHKPRESFLIPTAITFTLPTGIRLISTTYPEPVLATFSFSEEKMAVYEHTVIVTSMFKVADTYAPQNGVPTGTVKYQACSDVSCFAPAQLPINITQTQPQVAPQEPNEVVAQPTSENKDLAKARNVLEKGILYALVAFFLFGLALNLTPCVYPVIPITISYFAGQGAKTKGAQITLAAFYTLGIALVFAVLGLVSAAAGNQWGFLFQNVWFVIGIALIMLTMSASMFGAFEIALPQKFMTAGNAARSGYIGSLLMGLTVGAIIAPCASGIIIGLVTLVAQTGMIIRGTLLFFVMGLGLGVPYLFLAAFSGSLNKLPKSGLWMIWIKKVFGIMLVGLAFYFLAPQLARAYNLKSVLLGLTTLFGGLYLGFLDHAAGYTRIFKIFRSLLGIALMLTGFFMIQNNLHEPTGIKINWEHYSESTIDQLIGSGKPVFLDFYADWCAPCKKMDAETLSDNDIVQASRNFTCIKIDCTSPNKATTSIMEKFKITGVPSYVFLTPLGIEKKELRSIGFESPEKFLNRLQQADH